MSHNVWQAVICKLTASPTVRDNFMYRIDEMSQLDKWTSVDNYIEDLLVPADQVLNQVLDTNLRAGLPAINVSPSQGKFLQILARSIRAKRILEVGTLGGYSTVWLARALPEGGRLITLEIDPNYAEVAKENVKQAGLSDIVDVRLGKAIELLPVLESEQNEPFDFIFIDADKQNNPAYFQWALKLSQPGSLIIVDNVIRAGAVTDEDSADPQVQGVRSLNALMSKESRIVVTEIQTVGSKGYDGFAIALVIA